MRVNGNELRVGFDSCSPQAESVGRRRGGQPRRSLSDGTHGARSYQHVRSPIDADVANEPAQQTQHRDFPVHTP